MNLLDQQNAEFLLNKIQESDAVLVGAGSGFSAADGHLHWYQPDEVFRKTFAPFIKKYGIQSSFDGFYYPYRTPEERWAYIATLVNLQRQTKAGKVYKDLKILLADKPYFIMTTNQDFLFYQDFPEERIASIQGDSRYFQDSRGIVDELYDNKEMVEKMLASIKPGDTKVAPETIPRMPDGTEMMPWARHPGFLEKTKYHDECRKIREFIDRWKGKKILFLELGVGRMTPMFIQEPFWNLTYQLPFAYYISVNPKDALLPEALNGKGRAIHEDIARLFKDAVEMKENETN